MHDFEVMLAISPSLEKSSSDCPRLRCDEMHICLLEKFILYLHFHASTSWAIYVGLKGVRSAG